MGNSVYELKSKGLSGALEKGPAAEAIIDIGPKLQQKKKEIHKK